MERAMMKDDKEMYENILKISQKVEIMYEAIEKEIEEKQQLQLQLQATT